MSQPHSIFFSSLKFNNSHLYPNKLCNTSLLIGSASALRWAPPTPTWASEPLDRWLWWTCWLWWCLGLSCCSSRNFRRRICRSRRRGRRRCPCCSGATPPSRRIPTSYTSRLKTLHCSLLKLFWFDYRFCWKLWGDRWAERRLWRELLLQWWLRRGWAFFRFWDDPSSIFPPWKKYTRSLM